MQYIQMQNLCENGFSQKQWVRWVLYFEYHYFLMTSSDTLDAEEGIVVHYQNICLAQEYFLNVLACWRYLICRLTFFPWRRRIVDLTVLYTWLVGGMPGWTTLCWWQKIRAYVINSQKARKRPEEVKKRDILLFTRKNSSSGNSVFVINGKMIIEKCARNQKI